MKQEQEIDKELERVNNWCDIQTRLVLHFRNSFSGAVQSEHVFDALFLLLADKENLAWPGSLWDIDLTFDEALKLLEKFDFNVLLNPIETSTEILPAHLVIRYKVRIKVKGMVWVIHRYDADPFPSNPHAHQVANNIKLDLSNGYCYKHRQFVHTINKKTCWKFDQQLRKFLKGIYHR